MHQLINKYPTREPFYKRRWVRRTALLVLLLFLMFGLYRAIRPDPNLKKIKQLREEFAKTKALTPDQRREMRTAMAKLSPTQREALAAEGRQRFEDQLRRYAQMTPAEKVRHLDEQIKRGEQMRQQFAQRPQTPGGGFGAGPRASSHSPEERERRRRERLNQTTPEFRALMDLYRKDITARRQQLGLPAMGGWARQRA
ncbi:MAG TPA: hypothetical protein VKD90_25795 [Gemmataceae bacterium]|nr:hypothetical protein [Gemmataceae bacterium]